MHEDTEIDAELAVLHRLASRAREAANRVAWRSAMQRRSSGLAALLRFLPKVVVTSTARRTRVAGCWVIVVDAPSGVTVVMDVEAHTKGRTVDGLAAPFVLHVYRPELVRLDRLQELERAGTVKLVVDEATT